MSSDFDFGNFLDLDNQSTLKINCIKLFENLCIHKKTLKELDALKQVIISDPISKSFSGFYDAIGNLKFTDKGSISNVFPHLNLMINTLNDNGKSDIEIARVKNDLKEKLHHLFDSIDNGNDVWMIAQIYEFIEPGSKTAVNLIRILDLEVSDSDTIKEIKQVLKSRNIESNLEQFLTRLLAQETRGFITGDLKQVLLDRGVEDRFVNLVTKDSVKNLTKESLTKNKLFLITFDEEMLDVEPDFVDKITQNGIILTSTASESEKGFVFLVLSTTNEKGTSFFDSYHKLIREVR
tara:strand:- start:406 stop:1284 length:879 start_codon:yes stop_codon:yes gene_type:complete